MKRVFAAALFCTLFSALLVGCSVKVMSSLEELAKPYTGVYECTGITYGDTTHSGKYTLELAYGGGFCMNYAIEGGEEGSLEGTYRADPDRGEITFTAPLFGRNTKRTFAMREGKIILEEVVLGKLLRAEFSR